MGSERVISLRLQLKGEQEVLAQLNEVNATLDKSGQILKDINEKSKALDALTRKLKSMTEELESVSRRLAAAQNGTGTGDTGRLEGQQRRLREEIEQTRKSVAQLRKELQGAEQGSDAYNDLIKKIAQAKGEQKLLNDEIRKQQVAFERTQVAAGSYRDLELQLQQLRAQYKLLGEAQIKAGVGDPILKNIQMLDGQLKQIDKNMGVYTRNVGNYASAFDGFIGVTQRLAPIIGLTVGITEFIDANARASDEVANVAKTANASIPSIRKLQEELKFRDTRTSLVEQLQIAEIGGQLGVAEKDLRSFAEATDVVTVALKDEFGGSVEEVTKSVATLRNVIPGLKTDDVGRDILQIGNALNFLSASGNATAPAIADFVNRLSGIAGPLDVGKASLFGLSATLDELGVSAERGATAVQKTLFRIGEAPDKFAAIAGKGAAEFRKLVEDDIVSAFGLVTKGAQESSEKNTEFIRLLGELGIKGSRELEVFGKLGQNFDLLTQRVTEAGEALESTASVQQEFEKKNETFGASIAKLRNAIINLTVNTDLQDFLSAGIDLVSGLINVLAGLFKLLTENKTEFLALAAAIAVFNREAIIATLATIKQSAAYVLLTDATRRQAIAQGIMNSVMKALPLLAVIALVYAAVKAYQALTTSTDAASRSAKTLADAQKDIAKEAAKEAAALNKSFEILKNSASSLDDRAKAIKTLQETYPEYLKGLDIEKLSISELTKLQNQLNDSILRSVAERRK
ncbi:MAG TPA: phage tail tape measure protein, partial [Saprospiraceae bacterium]|nr:phage tail tape measure protein [Saprospiraceae bacterium]